MTPRRADIGASVTARLLNQARQQSVDYQTLLTTFCLERFLYRLGQSIVRERFVLKGAMLLRVWSHQPYRATRDLDFLRRGEGSFAAIQADVQAIVSTEVEDDGVQFDLTSVRVEDIRAEDGYRRPPSDPGSEVWLGSRTSSTSTTWRDSSNSIGSLWRRPFAGPSHVEARRFPRRLSSHSRTPTGRTPRGPRKCARSPDVWTSAGVTVGVAAVVATGWLRLNPIVGLPVAAICSKTSKPGFVRWCRS